MNRNWLIQASSVLVFVALFASSPAQAGPYDFDDDNKNDMRSAWLMCATVGFTLGECPSVFVNCWKPPLIYLSCKRGRCKIKTHCLKLPSWNTSDSAIQNALAYAEANAPPAVAYSSATPAATPTELVPPICLDIPELCPTAEQEALYEAEDAALAACLETPGADCSGFGAGFDDGPGLPAICTDNPGLCDDVLAGSR